MILYQPTVRKLLKMPRRKKTDDRSKCVRSHEMTPENTTANGSCRACMGITSRNYYLDNKEEINARRKEQYAAKRLEKKTADAIRTLQQEDPEMLATVLLEKLAAR